MTAVYAWATCPRCQRRLYPHPARRTVDGWACTGGAACSQRARALTLTEEITFFRGFGWPADRIAQRLNVTVSCVEKRLAREAA